jgi:hypothetical protein
MTDELVLRREEEELKEKKWRGLRMEMDEIFNRTDAYEE